MGAKGTDIASATPDLSTATGDWVDITGSTTITAFGTVTVGQWRVLRFTGAPLITYNASSLILPGAANIQTAANDWMVLRSLGSGNWVCMSYLPTGGLAALARADQVISGGASVTWLSLGTVTSGTLTPDPGDRPGMTYTNGGAHTLAPGAVTGAYYIEITNNGSAGAITTSGWGRVSGGAFTTTNGNKFLCAAVITPATSYLFINPAQ